MGNVTSQPGDAAPLFVRDQARFEVAACTVANGRGQTLLKVSPNAFPATKYLVQRELGDDSPVEYVQDPEQQSPNAPPDFLLRLSNADDLQFTFTFVVRQPQANQNNAVPNGLPVASTPAETNISGLTYVFASSQREVENLVVREFFADPNLHKNPNVQLVGDYGTSGSASVQFSWTWRWRPPKEKEDKGGGWRNTCSFVEYDQRAHRLNSLVTFSFWVKNDQRYLSTPRTPRLEIGMPPKFRVPSAQSIESRVSNSAGGNISDSEGEGSYKDLREPQSPVFESIPEDGLSLVPTLTNAGTPVATVKVDVATCKPGEDPVMNEDGPVFRATMRSLEQRTANMRLRMKKVLRAAEAARAAQRSCNDAVADFTDALHEASSSNANAVRPALDHYFESIAREILAYERQNATNLQKLIIDPISKLYNIEIKQADVKKREFDEESKEYYAYVSKYLGQRSESVKEKKIKQSDEKYQAKRRTFELKRFDYSTFMHDLHGGRKDQEVLSQLTKYADTQARGYLNTAKKVEDMMPRLDALVAEVRAAERDYQLQRTEREEKRRMLEKSSKLPEEGAMLQTNTLAISEGGSSRVVSTSLSASPPASAALALHSPTGPTGMLSTPGSAIGSVGNSPNSRFKGIRDLDDSGGATSNGTYRKEGLLWALSKPGSHVDPKSLNKTAWHKFWIVLDQGKLSEYVNWKDRLDLHMEPIDLRVASVREARSSERRFCFEVITPHFTRVYQAPSEEDMKSWIAAVNNALQTAFESRDMASSVPATPSPVLGSTRKDIAAVLTGKSSSFSGHRQLSSSTKQAAMNAVLRNATTAADKPMFYRTEIENAEASAFLNRIREVDEGNKVCADCNSDKKVDWCSINLGVLLCIECSGIHRSLGTHISKVRSLTLDTSAFTQDITEVLLLIGNRVSNMIWEAKLDRFLKPAPHSTREQRLHFITNKYGDRIYVQAPAGGQHPDDLLLTSIKRNDLKDVLHALALKANPNARDRVRSTHALFLALAAADPASPSASASASSPGRSSPRAASAQTAVRKPFAMAELLLQNGAEIPSEPPPIPLSEPAKAYIDFKTDQRLGKLLASPKDVSGDGMMSLPPLREKLPKRSSAVPVMKKW